MKIKQYLFLCIMIEPKDFFLFKVITEAVSNNITSFLIHILYKILKLSTTSNGINLWRFNKIIKISNITFTWYYAVYINHRPAFGLSVEEVLRAFRTLNSQKDQPNVMNRNYLLHVLQHLGSLGLEWLIATLIW